jgi:hypothetical protein
LSFLAASELSVVITDVINTPLPVPIAMQHRGVVTGKKMKKKWMIIY